MKKRNLYFLGIFIISISVICTFLSCKSHQSSPYSIVEQTASGTCSYTYPKYDENNKTILRYCFTECDRCPSETDIDDFNVSKEGREKVSNELCPLTEKNTHYLDYDKIPDLIKCYIDPSFNLELKKLDEGSETVYEDITKNKAINADPNDIDNDGKILDNCSRDFLFAKYKDKSSSVGTIIRKDSTNNKIPLEEEYGYGIYTDSPFQFKDYGLTHAKDGNPTTLWWFYPPRSLLKKTTSEKSTDDSISLEKYLNAPENNSLLLEYFKNVMNTSTFQDAKKYLPSGWRLPRKDECVPELAKLTRTFILSLRYGPIRIGDFKFTFWLSSTAGPNMYNTCVIDPTMHSAVISYSQENMKLTPLAVKDRPTLIKSETFKPFKDFSDRWKNTNK